MVIVIDEIMNIDNNKKLNERPATEALSQNYDFNFEEYLRHSAKTLEECRYMACPRRKRRKREFGVEEILEMLKPIEESISCPPIIWEYDDCHISHGLQSFVHKIVDHVESNKVSVCHPKHSDQSYYPKPPRQRGLTRSKSIKRSLSSLASDTNLAMAI
jgi:hypothetical protein